MSSGMPVPTDLTRATAPWVVVTSAANQEVRQSLQAFEARKGIVRFLDSSRMMDERSLFQEFAERLELHGYFGHNWDALVECLDDLHGSWHGRRPVTAVIRHVDLLVGLSYFPLFVSVLCQAAWASNLNLDADFNPQDRELVPLHFFLLVDEVNLNVVTAVLSTRQNLVVEGDDRCVQVRLSDDFWS